jgi:hypothetical protein
VNLIIATVALLLGATALGVAIHDRKSTPSGQQGGGSGPSTVVVLPDEVGQPEGQAQVDLEVLGLDMKVTAKRIGTDTPGKVISQDPKAGTTVPSRSLVTLVVGI